ncbi:MAG: hypothetical protein JSV04_15390 [Candidatus Heimdallarchaeota archaeon]|nr:MAG: hypothetical protein JSV04_15390 [Candidatus Heimdallarchaeota archaeon]
MKKGVNIIVGFLLSFLVLSNVVLSTGRVTQEPEWKVQVGDSQTYTVVSYFDDLDIDGNGDKHSQALSVQDENGTTVTFLLKTGSQIKVEISALNGRAMLKWTYDGKITSQVNDDGDPPYSYVIKTVNNKTYWEERFQNETDYSIVDDFIVFSSERRVADTMTKMDIRRDWMTGWLIDMYVKLFNETDTITELGLSSIENSTATMTILGTSRTTTITSFPFLPLIIGLAFIVGFFRKKRKITIWG